MLFTDFEGPDHLVARLYTIKAVLWGILIIGAVVALVIKFLSSPTCQNTCGVNLVKRTGADTCECWPSTGENHDPG